MRTDNVLRIPPRLCPVRVLADLTPAMWRALLERLQPERRPRGQLATVTVLDTWRRERGR